LARWEWCRVALRLSSRKTNQPRHVLNVFVFVMKAARLKREEEASLREHKLSANEQSLLAKEKELTQRMSRNDAALKVRTENDIVSSTNTALCVVCQS